MREKKNVYIYINEEEIDLFAIYYYIYPSYFTITIIINML